jgi:hypothetical protein
VLFEKRLSPGGGKDVLAELKKEKIKNQGILIGTSTKP